MPVVVNAATNGLSLSNSSLVHRGYDRRLPLAGMGPNAIGAGVNVDHVVILTYCLRMSRSLPDADLPGQETAA